MSEKAGIEGKRGDEQVVTGNEHTPPDIIALMAEIRARVTEQAEGLRDELPPFRPLEASTLKVGDLLHSAELKFLNQHYGFGPKEKLDRITSHRPGIIGKFIVKAKRKVIVLFAELLRDYFSDQREFQANLVRYLNDVSRSIASNFWELTRKIEHDTTKALEKIDRLHDDILATVHSSERRTVEATTQNIGELQITARKHEDQLRMLDSVVSGLESILARAKSHSVSENTPSTEETPVQIPPLDYSYLLLENRFRGSEEELSKRLSIYPPLFAPTALRLKKPVLEIGAGRGELQTLFRAEGVPSYGVDLDAAMVERATSLGLDVRLEDGLSHLAKLPPRSLSGVIAVQVVEHLTREQLHRLFTLCREKVEQGGTVIFETINPRSVLALSSNYFRDPTHVWPLHPDTLAFGIELAGLQVKDVRYLSPVPEGARLASLPFEAHYTPKFAVTIELLNRNVQQLNELLYGYQDYCIIAEVR